jgi:ATP-dependent DNA ligase
MIEGAHSVPAKAVACPGDHLLIAEYLHLMCTDHPAASFLSVQGFGLAVEPKYDGFRGLVYLAAGTCLIRSKKSTTFKRFASLCEALPRELDVKNAILNGEVLALAKTGQPQFTDLFTGPTALAYAAFDLLWLNGRDLRHLPLTKRKAELEKLVPAPGVHVCPACASLWSGRDSWFAEQRLDRSD